MISYFSQAKHVIWAIIAVLVLFNEVAQAGDWPKWRGPSADAYVAKGDLLPNMLGNTPKVLWKINAGPGHSAVVIQGNLIAISEEQDGFEVLRILEKHTGKELWKTAFGETYPNDGFGAGPRCTPLFNGELIYVQTCRGKLSCLRVKDGSKVWSTDYQKNFNVKWIVNKAQNIGAASRRGYSGTPLVNGNHLICQVGSEDNAGIVCFNKYNGKVIWKSQNDLASYASPLIAEISGKKQFITLTTERLIGIDTTSGYMLWSEPVPTRAFRNVLTPVTDGNNVIVASHSEGMICVSGKGKSGKAILKWKNPKLKINLSTPVIVGKHLYGFAEKDRFICVDTSTGKLSWEERGFGSFYASTLTDGKKLLVLGQLGELVLIRPDPNKYEEIDRMQVCGKSWSFPGYSNGRLFVRDQKTLQCVQLLK
jgi:outer membrane protein assembly factor BamB